MFNYVVRKIVGTRNQRELRKLAPLVARINEREGWAKALSDEQLREQVRGWKGEVAAAKDKAAVLEKILPDCFAVTREASARALGMRHFDVQLIGGIALHRGTIAEMKTGEGKTLVATLPCVLNALEGKGFDYLRDNMKFRLADYVQRELHYAIVDEVDSILIDEARTPLIISGPSEESTDKYYKINKVIPGLVRDRDFTVDEKARSVVLTDEGVEKVEQKLGVQNLYDPEEIETLHHVEQALRAHTLYRKDHEYVVKDGEVIIVDDFTGRLMPGRRWSDGLHQAVEAKENVKIENENQTLATVSFQNYFRLYTKLCGMTGTADTEAEEFGNIYKLDVMVIPTNRINVRNDLQDTVYKTEREKFNAVCDEIVKLHEKGQPILVGTVSIAKSEVLSQLLKKRGIPHDVLNAKQHEREAELVAQAGRKGRITISTNMAGRGTDILLGGNAEFLARREAGAEPSAAEVEGRLVQERSAAARAAGEKQFSPVTAAEVEAALQADLAAWRQRYEAVLTRYKSECVKEHGEVVAAGGLHILGTERHESRRIDNQLRGRAGRQGDPGSSRFFLSLEDDLMRIFASDPARVRRRDEPAAQDGLRHAQGSARRGRGHAAGLVHRGPQVEEEDPPRESGLLAGPGGAPLRPDRGPDHRDGRRGGAARQERRLGAGGTRAAGEGAVQHRHQPQGRGDRCAEAAARHLQRGREEAEGQAGDAGQRLPRLRAVALPERDRPALEGPPAADGPSPTRNPPARLRAEGPQDRIQEGGIRALPDHEGPHRRLDGIDDHASRAGAASGRAGGVRGLARGSCGRRRFRGKGRRSSRREPACGAAAARPAHHRIPRRVPGVGRS